MTTTSQSAGSVELGSPVRNRYFYGKLLDVFHFELEQNYFNNKRWLLNRAVTGYGVICGLNVQIGSDNRSVVVTPGVAIDKCGREIIVCQQSDPLALPPPTTPPPATTPSQPTTPSSTGAVGTGTSSNPTSTSGSSTAAAAGPSANGGDCTDTGTYCHLCICYHECLTDPSPTLGGDCDCQSACAPGSIREKYCIKILDGKICPASTTSPLQSVINAGSFSYAALARYVANSNCFAPVEDCCIPLANIAVPVSPNPYSQNGIDVSIRPIVYTNDLLYDLILAWMSQGTSAVRGTK